MSGMHDHPAYQEGRESYFSNKGKYINPYQAGTPAHNAFERGWSQALKKSPEIKNRDDDLSSLKEELEQAAKKLEKEKAKKAYLKGKGY